MSHPVLKQVSLSASLGGKVQIIKFDVSSDYHLSESRTWEIPEDWSEEEVGLFIKAEREDIRTRLESLGDAEFEERWDQSYLSKR